MYMIVVVIVIMIVVVIILYSLPRLGLACRADMPPCRKPFLNTDAFRFNHKREFVIKRSLRRARGDQYVQNQDIRRITRHGFKLKEVLLRHNVPDRDRFARGDGRLAGTIRRRHRPVRITRHDGIDCGDIGLHVKVETAPEPLNVRVQHHYP